MVKVMLTTHVGKVAEDIRGKNKYLVGLLSVTNQRAASVVVRDITEGTDIYDYVAGWKGGTDFSLF